MLKYQSLRKTNFIALTLIAIFIFFTLASYTEISNSNIQNITVTDSLNDFEVSAEVETHQQSEGDDIAEEFTHFFQNSHLKKTKMILTLVNTFHYKSHFFDLELPPPRF